MPSEIIVKIHFAGDREASVFLFDNIKKAAVNIRGDHPNDPIEYVMEIERGDEGICRGFDAKDAFEAAWYQLEYADLLEQYHDQPRNHPDNICQDNMLNRAEGPVFTEPGIRKSVSRNYINAGVE